MNNLLAKHSHPTNSMRIAWWSALAALLLLPAIAMQFTSSVAWGPGDFVLMGGLLLLLGLAVEFAFAKGRTAFGRVVLAGSALAAFLLIWAELAVGIFD